MSEHDDAIRLANKILDQPSRDPDDDLSILARQFLRAIEPKWRPIKTAKKDSGWILVYGPGGVYVNRVDKWGQLRNRLGRPTDGATLWQPTPLSPNEEEAPNG